MQFFARITYTVLHAIAYRSDLHALDRMLALDALGLHRYRYVIYNVNFSVSKVRTWLRLKLDVCH